MFHKRANVIFSMTDTPEIHPRREKQAAHVFWLEQSMVAAFEG